MVIETVCIPFTHPVFEVRIFALFKGSKTTGPFDYPQDVRRGRSNHDPESTTAAHIYKVKLTFHVERLINAISGSVDELDALLSPLVTTLGRQNHIERASTRSFL